MTSRCLAHRQQLSTPGAPMTNRVHKNYASIVGPGTTAFAKIADTTHLTSDTEWLATEKLHGCNFCMVAHRKVDGSVETYCCRRRGILLREDRFYNGYAVLDRYHSALLAALATVHGDRNDCRVFVFGELIGGYYPGNPPGDWNSLHDGAPVRVQAGIHYCPHNEFIAFDLHDGEHYMDFLRARELLIGAGFMAVDILATGTFQDMIKLDPHFTTTIPPRFGLPPVPDNIAEGYVVRPTAARALIKIKSQRFAEISRCPAERVRAPKPKLPKEVTEQVKLATNELSHYMTLGRLQSVVSKFGEGNVPPARLGGLLAQDALKDFQDQEHSVYFLLTPDEQREVRKAAFPLAFALVQQNEAAGKS